MTATYQIAKFSKCEVVEDGGVYRVMSLNGICLFQAASAVKAYEYAEWFDAKEAARGSAVTNEARAQVQP